MELITPVTILDGCHSQDLAETYVAEFIESKCANKKILADPLVIFMVGLPGSGKTYIRSRCAVSFGLDSFIVIDVDEILDRFYNNSNKCYKESYKIFRLLIDACVKRRLSIILEGTGKDLFKDIREFKRKKYTTMLCVNLVKISIAQQRAVIRAEKTGRVVRPEYIQGVYDMFKSNIPSYLELPEVDYVRIFTNNGNVMGTEIAICEDKAQCLIKKEEVARLLIE